jgi:serine/alanine adding enzyme
MAPDRKSLEHQILKDPVAALSALRPDAVNTHHTALKKLCDQHLSLKQQHQVLQVETRVISRKIGDAKAKGYAIADLKAAMQEQCGRLKSNSRLLDNIEKQILSYFDIGKVPFQDGSTPSSNQKRSSDATMGGEFHQVSIAMLEDETKEWNAYVLKHPAASLYHRAEWRELIRRTFGHTAYYFTARDKSHNIIGILPLIRLKSRIFGDFMVSMPYFNFGGAIADHPVIERQLMETANTQAAGLGVVHIEYRDVIEREALPVRTEKVNMILELPESIENLWKGFSSKLRSQIKRPQRERPEILVGGKAYLEDFYEVFSRNMRDLGTPVYGKAFFSNILDCFTQQSTIIHIRLHGKPVAAALLLGHRDTLEIPWASTIREVNHLSMNMLLYWEVLKFAVTGRYKYFDFGRSSKDSGTYRFKQQWGAQPQQLHWHYWLKDRQEMPSLNPENPRYAMAIKVWQHLPLQFTNWLGPKIVGNLP